MAPTTLDPNTALIIVEIQQGIIGLPGIHPIGDIIGRPRELADAFRERDMTGMRPEAHNHSIRHVFPRLDETGATQAIIGLLPARSV